MQALTLSVASDKGSDAMTTLTDAKRMARNLREALAARSITVTHSQALEVTAQTLGHADWNTLSGLDAAPAPVELKDAVPILRIFDVPKAEDFYLRLLGFQVDWRHRFGDDFPLYMQISRDGLRLQLSEHNGDGTPGTVVFLDVHGLDAWHAELTARGNRAGIEPGPNPSMRVLQLWDPFGNRLRFAETTRPKGEPLPKTYTVGSRSAA
jgi:catechol 2,3-dioxygenase-like lactoylglutathione lyase family enzyme